MKVCGRWNSGSGVAVDDWVTRDTHERAYESDRCNYSQGNSRGTECSPCDSPDHGETSLGGGTGLRHVSDEQDAGKRACRAGAGARYRTAEHVKAPGRWESTLDNDAFHGAASYTDGLSPASP